jgi:hypothetical protein
MCVRCDRLPNDILNVSHFNATAYGANHLLLGANAAGFHPAVHQDYPGAPFDSGNAMMANFNSIPSSHRRGFDVQLTPFKAAWMEDDGSDPYQRLRSAIALNESLPKMLPRARASRDRLTCCSRPTFSTGLKSVGMHATCF